MESEELHIRIKAILEVVGKPKQYIEKTLSDYIEKIKQDDNLMIVDSKISDAVEEKDEVWATFAEIELVIKGTTNLVGFCIDYMPSSIEIIKPESFAFESRIFTNFINDIQAKLHRIDLLVKNLSTENTFLKKNMNTIIKNNLSVLIKLGINKLDGLSTATGIESPQVEKFLKSLIEEKKIKEENGIFEIVENG
jgi:hypothetical protein